MKLQDLQTLDVPLTKLVAWEGNVRTTDPDQNIDELAASIHAHGLLQSLVIQATIRNRYFVVAGRRRLLALCQLQDAGKLPARYQVPCRLAPEDADLTELSLAENVEREPMAPLAECASFQALIEGGKSITDIAVRFGYTERTVEKRLALARLSPILQNAYRAGEINMDVLQSFTLNADHQAQEQVWANLQPWARNNPQHVRQMLCAQTIPATDARVAFVGLAAYEAEGGAVQRDLFHDQEGHGVYLTDAALLARLVELKLNEAAAGVCGTGWRWVEIQPELDHRELGKYRRIQGKLLPLSPKLQKQLDVLEKKRADLRDKLSTAEEGEACEEDKLAKLDQSFREIEDRIEAINAQREYEFPKKVKAACGVIVSVGEETAQFTYGLLRKEDQHLLEPKNKPTAEGDQTNRDEEGTESDISPAPTAEGNDTPASPLYSASLVEDLTTAKTAAIAIELTRQPEIALAALVHSMLLGQFGIELGDYRRSTCLDISTRHPNLEPAKSTKAYLALEEQNAHWLARLSKEASRPGKLWPWCLAQPQDTLLSLLAFCTAQTVTAIQKKDADSANLLHANALADALKMDMANWFTPTAENFFGRISKPQIAQALAEIGKTPGASQLAMKKAPFAELAEKETGGTGWLPAPLCITTPPPAADESEE